MCIYINKKLNSLPEQVEENKENIATNTTAIATNTSDISDIQEEQTTQNGRLTDVEEVASGEVINRKLLIDDETISSDDYTRIKGTNILVMADDTESYMSIKGDETLHIYQTQADNSGSSIQMSSSGVQIATSDEDGVIQGRINVKANGDIEISRQYEGTQYGKLLMTNQGLYYTDAQTNEFAMVNGNLTLNDDTLIQHLYRYSFTDDNDITTFQIYSNISFDVSSTDETLTQDDLLKLYNIFSQCFNDSDDFGYAGTPDNSNNTLSIGRLRFYRLTNKMGLSIYIYDDNDTNEIVNVEISVDSDNVYTINNIAGYVYINKYQIF